MAPESEEFDREEMSREAAERTLREAGVGTLSLADGDVAYGVPVSFGFDAGADDIYFAFLRGTESRKEAFAETTAEASLTVFDVEGRHDWHSVVAAGPIEAVGEDADPEARDRMAAALESARYPDLFSGAVPARGVRGYVLHVETLTGFRSGDAPPVGDRTDDAGD